MSIRAHPTNNALLTNFRLSSECRNFATEHRLSMQVGAKRAKTCMQCVRCVPTELPFCMPPLVVGQQHCEHITKYVLRTGTTHKVTKNASDIQLWQLWRVVWKHLSAAPQLVHVSRYPSHPSKKRCRTPRPDTTLVSQGCTRLCTPRLKLAKEKMMNLSRCHKIYNKKMQYESGFLTHVGPDLESSVSSGKRRQTCRAWQDLYSSIDCPTCIPSPSPPISCYRQLLIK